jgi:hypothetical protein
VSKDLRAALSKQATYRPGPSEPIALFRSLKIRSGSSIKEMWAPQADALREWDAQRQAKDVLFQLNTGAGKTLIGLIAALSLVNETRAKVVYCCATRQLVEQTKAKADELGIPAATYLGGGSWTEPEVYQRARGPVITTYAALFNGRSIFREDDVAAVVFDDSHTAHDCIRSAFTLHVDRAAHPELYDLVVGLFADYFRAAGRQFVYDAVVERREPSTVLMAPMFEVVRRAEKLRELLLAHGAETHRDFKFPWAHLGERLDQCALLFDGASVQVTPLLPPVEQVRAFRAGVRRLYLSATMRVNDEFIRTFGRMPSLVITPGGRAGDTERLFLTTRSNAIDEVAHQWADEATRGLKTLIMTPTKRGAESWAGEADVFTTDLGHNRIRQFAQSSDERLVFVARYDGVDLPDDACRVMVVDGLPSGISLLDRFFEQHLERTGISDSKIASRFVQILGRTSRGMSDYGAVLLIGRRLLEWVLAPKHRALLPEHVQRQLAVGERLSDLVAAGDFTARELLDKCLGQDQDWRDIYDSGMQDDADLLTPTDADRALWERLATAERSAADAMWRGEPEKARTSFLSVRDEAFSADRNLAAWFLHWAGFAAQLAGDMSAATTHYQAAARVKRDLGIVPDMAPVGPVTDASSASPQAIRMAALLKERGATRATSDLAQLAADLSNSGASAGVHEEAIRSLGEYLGYDASRPEKPTNGKGPDALWALPDRSVVLLFDAKTRKVNKHYDKDLVGKSAQHALWAAAQYPSSDRQHFIVGPRVPATPQATPPAGLRVLTAGELAGVAGELARVYDRAAARNLPTFHAAEIEAGLIERGLTWEALPRAVESVRLDNL